MTLPPGWISTIVLSLMWTASGAAIADDGPAAAETAKPSTAQMAARVDQLLDRARQAGGGSVGQPASDVEFLRRVHLDLSGIIPSVHTVRTFLADDRPGKRQDLVDSLLDRPRHATHLANTWRKMMLPSGANIRQLGGAVGFQNWLRNHFADDTPYDEMVRELILASGNANQTGPVLYYTALNLKPEELAASTSQVFLGVQISCAQCHDHPFDHWTREDFWGYAAFFARLQRPTNPQQRAFQVVEASTGEVKIPDTEQVVAPKYLAGESPSESAETKRRELLADWITSSTNPYFARAAANRVWAHLFGYGLVNPVDDLGAHNPPTHPELLDELAQYFVASGYDLEELFRVLVRTKAYQRTSRIGAEGEQAAELYSHMAIKSLSAEQLYDCLGEAMRRRAGNVTGQRALQFRFFDQNRQAFLAKFDAPAQGATEFQAGIPQALSLMNGRLIAAATDLANSDLLAAIEAPWFTDAERVEVLFLSTLSRPPSESERARFESHVSNAKARAEKDSEADEKNPDQLRRQALGDVLWALLNSAEFILNH